MSWKLFSELTPEQAIVAQQQLTVHVDRFISSLVKPDRREYQVVDGQVKGSRLLYTKLDQEFMDAILEKKPRSKTDLQDWKSTPTPFYMDEK